MGYPKMSGKNYKNHPRPSNIINRLLSTHPYYVANMLANSQYFYFFFWINLVSCLVPGDSSAVCQPLQVPKISFGVIDYMIQFHRGNLSDVPAILYGKPNNLGVFRPHQISTASAGRRYP